MITWTLVLVMYNNFHASAIPPTVLTVVGLNSLQICEEAAAALKLQIPLNVSTVKTTCIQVWSNK